MKKHHSINSVLIYIALVLVSLIVLFPMLWAISASLRSDEELFHYVTPASVHTFIPVNITLDAYRKIFEEYDFLRPILNTLYVSFFSIFLGLVVNSVAAFAFASFRFKGDKLIYSIILITFMIPFDSIAFPLYQIVHKMGLLNTYTGIYLPCIANGLVLFLFVQFFKDIPANLMEAAHIDGASWVKTFFSIVMPLSVPVYITAGLMIFITQWNAYLWPLLVAQSESIRLIQTRLGAFKTEQDTLWSCIYAASMVSAAIPLCLFLPFQKYYIQGVTSSGVKG